MAYLRAGSFTQSNGEPCLPASLCFSSHRCNYCTEAWLARSPHRKAEDYNFCCSSCNQHYSRKYLEEHQWLKCGSNWLICDIKMDTGDVLCAGCWDALIIVDAHAHLAPASEKWDDKRGNFLFLSRWVVIVWATVGGVAGGLCETSPFPFLLTKTLIHRNYTDRLKYTARQGITPIMQSWLKLGPHARVLQEHGRSQDVHQRSTEHIRPVNI